MMLEVRNKESQLIADTKKGTHTSLVSRHWKLDRAEILSGSGNTPLYITQPAKLRVLSMWNFECDKVKWSCLHRTRIEFSRDSNSEGASQTNMLSTILQHQGKPSITLSECRHNLTDEEDNTIGGLSAAAYQLGNTSSRTITEVKQR